MSATTAGDELRFGLAEAFDAIRGEFAPDSTLVLLKISEDTDDFAEVYEVPGKWSFAYIKNKTTKLEIKDKVTIQIADNSSELADAMAETTHFQLDSDIYTRIESDTIGPKSFAQKWQMYGELFTKPGQIKSLY